MNWHIISFLIGNCLVHQLKALPTGAELFGLGFLIFACFVLVKIKCFELTKRLVLIKRLILIRSLILLFLLFALGFLWTAIFAKQIQNQFLPHTLEKIPITISAKIISIPEKKDKHLWQFDCSVEEILNVQDSKTIGNIRLFWKDPPPLQVGDIWHFTVKLKRPYGFSNPGSFDEQKHFFSQKLVAKGSVQHKKPYYLASRDFFSAPIDKFRQSLKEYILNALSERNEKYILLALLIGHKEGISKDQWTVFRNTGTAHLMAISGLHVGLVSGFMFWFVRRFWNNNPFSKQLSITFKHLPQYPAIVMAAFGSVGVSLLYALISGFSVPTVRAFIMVLCFCGSILLRRVCSRWHAYFLALGVVLIINPLSTLSYGFWLSFGAVFFVLYVVKRQNKGFLQHFQVHSALFLGLLPVTLMMFKTVSLVSPIANVIAIPWVSFSVVPFILLGACFYIFGLNWLTETCFIFAATSLKYLWPILEWFSNKGYSTFTQSEFPILFLGLAMIGVLWIFAPKGIPNKSLGLIWMFPLLFYKPQGVSEGALRLTVLDVGQGLATIVETAHHVLVFDTGASFGRGSQNGSDCGERVLLPFFNARGIKNIDTVVISHEDNDHIGGLKSLLKGIGAQQILTSEPLSVQRLGIDVNINRQIHKCMAGQAWEWDGVKFEMLHPGAQNPEAQNHEAQNHEAQNHEAKIARKKKIKRNDHSCVLKVSAKNKSILLTGDIEIPSEKILIEKYRYKLHSTILVVPHHGSKTSSSQDFLMCVHPSFAVVTTGYLNQYGHPKPEIVNRYRELGIPLLETLRSGAITFLVTEDAIHIDEYRQSNWHYWY